MSFSYSWARRWVSAVASNEWVPHYQSINPSINPCHIKYTTEPEPNAQTVQTDFIKPSFFSISYYLEDAAKAKPLSRKRRKAEMGGHQSVPQKSIHEFTVKVSSNFNPRRFLFSSPHHVATLWKLIGLAQDSRGADVDLSTFKGKTIIVVNVASKWSPLFHLSQFVGFWFLNLLPSAIVLILFVDTAALPKPIIPSSPNFTPNTKKEVFVSFLSIIRVINHSLGLIFNQITIRVS